MNALADVSTPWYAVISVHAEPGLERLVIAYRDEESLRDLFAEPSIVALGYRSREEAAADMDSCPSAAPASAQKEKTMSLNSITQSLRNFVTSQSSLARKFGFLRTRNMVGQLLQHGIAVAIVLLFSENLLSKTVRAMVSF